MSNDTSLVSGYLIFIAAIIIMIVIGYAAMIVAPIALIWVIVDAFKDPKEQDSK